MKPDVAFAVGKVALYSAIPTKCHWIGIKKILRYIKGAYDLGFYYSNSVVGDLIGYFDSDWASDLVHLSPGEARNRHQLLCLW